MQDRDAPRYKSSMENVGRTDSSASPLQRQGEQILYKKKKVSDDNELYIFLNF